MKKLMITAAAALCATLGYSEITSQNVVGYQNVAARSGFKAMGPSFVAVAGEAIDLTKIDVTGYDPEEGTEGEVYVQGLDALGRGTGSYYYYDVPGELVGWLDGSDNEVEEGQVMIPAGDALWVSAPSSAYSIIVPGVTL